jgi:CRP-like cAMP-binding protein
MKHARMNKAISAKDVADLLAALLQRYGTWPGRHSVRKHRMVVERSESRWPLENRYIGSPQQIEVRFSELDASQLAWLAGVVQQRKAQAHEVILEWGDLHRGMFVVLTGKVEVLRGSADGETALNALDRGEIRRRQVKLGYGRVEW